MKEIVAVTTLHSRTFIEAVFQRHALADLQRELDQKDAEARFVLEDAWRVGYGIWDTDAPFWWEVIPEVR